MKKIVFLFSVLVVVLVGFNSCKQCKSEQPVVDTSDSTQIPAIDLINAEIAKDSLNPFLYFKRAKVYDVNGEYKSAVTDMFLALSLDSLRPEFYLYTAELFKKTGELNKGIALMDVAIATDSANTNYYVKASELAYIDTSVKGNYIMALNYLNVATVKDPQNADIYFYKGMVFRESGDTVKAISSFKTATELNPQYYNAYVQLGLLSRARKDKDAQKYFDNAIKVSDKPEDALYAKADIVKEEGIKLYDAGKYEQAEASLTEAINTFKKVVELNHRNIEAYMGIARSYYQLDSLQQAYDYYALAAKLEPTYAGAYFSQGLVAEEMGRKAEAIRLYQNCLNIDPTFKRAEEHLKGLQGAQ
ncbi:MAG: tetratricopeptide repeat protein [Bacteroidetes bacterium]|nr:tetratricopeptide repeat protein [Bacteroidota bacterium]